MAYVYRHIRLDKNEPFYIGISCDAYPNRCTSHLNRNKYWHNVVNKTPIRVEILFDDISYEEAKEKEKEFISLYGRIDLGLRTLVNMTNGGEGSLGIVFSEESKKKIGAGNKGRKCTEETKLKISLARKGFKHTEEVKRKIGDFKKGKKLPPRKPLSQEERQKMSINRTGRKYNVTYVITEEHRQKLRDGALGKKMSDACKLKMSENRSIPIIQYSKDGIFIKEWKSARLAALELFETNHSSNIVRCLKGQKPLAYGFKWEYYKH